MTSNIFLRTAATLAFSSLVISLTGGSPAKADEFRGHVEKGGNKRIARPLTGQSETVTANGGALKGSGTALGAANDFSLGANTNEASGNRLESNTNEWNPWGDTTSPGASHSLIATQAHTSTTPQTAVDYSAIERAYADAIPPISGAVNGSDQQITANGLTPLAAQAAMNRYAALNGNTHPIVDADNCACGTPVPSPHCMQSGQVGLYANRPNSVATHPGLGNVLNGTAVPGGNAAAAMRSGAGYFVGGGIHGGGGGRGYR